MKATSVNENFDVKFFKSLRELWSAIETLELLYRPDPYKGYAKVTYQVLWDWMKQNPNELLPCYGLWDGSITHRIQFHR